MKIARQKIWDNLSHKYCSNCKNTVEFENNGRVGPGVFYIKCPKCEMSFLINYLEDGQDLLEVEDCLSFPNWKD